MYVLCLYIVLACTVLVSSAPDSYVKGVSTVDAEIPSLFTFENGNVGVNFLGFKASAGLGGLLSGKSGFGGLHAEAGTPFGQAARAGIGGNLDGEGKAIGGLFADATAGGSVAAGAGLAGAADKEKSLGVSYAGASSGGTYKETAIRKTIVPIKKEPVPVEVVHKHVQMKPQKTYIEKTVIPDYEEKTIYVPSYVQKTVRVPTIVEKKVKVPVPPTIIEKSVEAPSDVNLETSELTSATYKPRKYRPFFTKHFFLGGALGAGIFGENTGANSHEEDNSSKRLTFQKSTKAEFGGDIFSV